MASFRLTPRYRWGFLLIILLAGLTLFAVFALRRSKPVVSTGVASSVPAIQTPQVSVGVATYTTPEGYKCYQYTVQNNSSQPVVGIDIGLDDNLGVTQLDSVPRGWSRDEVTGAAIHNQSVPTMVDVFAAEESEKVYMTTLAFRANPNETRGFSVCMQNDWDSSYKTAYWNAYYMDGTYESGLLADLGTL